MTCEEAKRVMEEHPVDKHGEPTAEAWEAMAHQCPECLKELEDELAMDRAELDALAVEMTDGKFTSWDEWSKDSAEMVPNRVRALLDLSTPKNG